jgi:hypothetical protein
MKQKPYTNFAVPDTDAYETAQEPSKTNHDALEAIRKMQSQGRVERPVTGVKTTVIEYPKTFNDWSNHIRHLLITR